MLLAEDIVKMKLLNIFLWKQPVNNILSKKIPLGEGDNIHSNPDGAT